MKRIFAVVLVVLVICLALVSCGKAKQTDLSFTNKLSTVAHSVYISHESESEWGDPINNARVSSGSTIYFDFDKLGNYGPGMYDVAVVDENNINYDVYEVTLAKGDNITFSASGETAIVTVTGADGATATYEGISYSGDDLPE